jgi:ethanolamine ammonia-lyase large subunit
VFGSGLIFSDLNPIFQIILDLTRIYSNIFNINFTFVFPSGKCVRLHITTRYELLRFFSKGNYIFYSELPGSGKIFFRNPDPTRSF